MAATLALGPIGSNFGSAAGPMRNPHARFHSYVPRLFAIDDASFEAMFPMLCVRSAQLGVKLSPKGPKLPHFGLGLPYLASS